MEGARPARASELPHVVTLARELRSELGRIRGGERWQRREARAEPLEAVFAELLERDDATVLAGTIDDTLVGYASVEIEELRDGTRLGRVDELYVEPDARGVGVGERLVDAAVAYCVENGCDGVDASALPGHREAKNFFESAGFTARALIMHRGLDAP